MEELHIVQKIAVMAPPLIFAIVLHEVAHGWVADKLGDHTARDAGRLTLNPISHIDLFGTILMPLMLFFATGGRMLFGYAKPVPIDPSNFKDPKKGMALSAIAGPGINMIMAISFAFLLRAVIPTLESLAPKQSLSFLIQPLTLMLGYGVLINVVLAVLNMLPIPPLDGSRIVYWLLPNKQAAQYYRLEPFIVRGFMYLIVLDIILNMLRINTIFSVFGLLSMVMSPIIRLILSLLLGVDAM